MRHQGRRRLLVIALSLALALGAGCRLDWDLGPRPPGPAADGGEAGPSIAPFSCGGALFCSTFDDGKLIPPWGQSFVGAEAGILRIEPSVGAPSAPNTLFAFRPPGIGAPNAAYAQTSNFAQTLTHTSLSFAIRPEQLDTAAHACVAGIIFDDGTPDEHVVRILVGAVDALVQDRIPDQSSESHPLLATPPRDRWSRMSITVDVKGQVVVLLDGATVLATPLNKKWTASKAARAFVGINFAEGVGEAFAFRFDDVRFDGR